MNFVKFVEIFSFSRNSRPCGAGPAGGFCWFQWVHDHHHHLQMLEIAHMSRVCVSVCVCVCSRHLRGRSEMSVYVIDNGIRRNENVRLEIYDLRGFRQTTLVNWLKGPLVFFS